MKKIILGLLTVCFLACGASKTVRESRKVIKGDWMLSSVSSSAIGDLKITLLNDSTKDCFEGSNWSFVPNNNTGTYTLNGTGCNDEERNFVFVIDEIDEATGLYDFLLKPTDKRGRSEANVGFRMNLTALSDTDMIWTQNANLDGSNITISMKFKKQ
ncbi:lipocalin family protein [Winogradskyella maritima]|uniref:Lipocalin family protein n=1 Tax=Winogradskyella maritima TaxID=1517766 RepID=A0ABV8AEI3_9FLAO|nr:lipocalin family protein [Winogradskyella maritima]